MAQGTHDFIDAGVDALKQGGHPFVLLALQDRQPNGERTYHIRSGYYDPRDVVALQDITAAKVPPYLEERRAEAEQEGGG